MRKLFLRLSIMAAISGISFTIWVQQAVAAQTRENPEVGVAVHSGQDEEDFFVKNGVLVEYKGHEAKVVIPDGITVIGERAFCANEDIVDVVLPEGLERIGAYAFSRCTFLETIQFPKSLYHIGEGAFWSDTNLIHIRLPEGLERLEKNIFRSCSFLETVQMPESLSYIGESAFYGCKRLKEIDLSSVKEIDCLAFSETGLVHVDLTGVEKLGDAVFAFTECDFGDLVHLPEMEGNAFWHSQYWEGYGKGEAENKFWIVDDVLLSGQCCSGGVEIPETVDKIAADAFYNNRKITSVRIPDSVTEIGEEAFNFCTRLKSVWMGDSVTKVGEFVFLHCSRLTNIRLSNQIEELPTGTFQYCYRLKELTLPERIKTVEEQALWIATDSQITVPIGIHKMYGVPSGGIIYVTEKDQISESSALKGLVFHEIKELALNNAELVLKVGEKYPLRFNSGAKAAWKSSKKSVAAVGQTGNIYAKKPGTTVITATIYGKEYSCTVKVVER